MSLPDPDVVAAAVAAAKARSGWHPDWDVMVAAADAYAESEEVEWCRHHRMEATECHPSTHHMCDLALAYLIVEDTE